MGQRVLLVEAECHVEKSGENDHTEGTTKHGNPVRTPHWPAAPGVTTQKIRGWQSPAYVTLLPPLASEKSTESEHRPSDTLSSVVAANLQCSADTMQQPSKHESQQLLTKFKSKGTANKVPSLHRCALIARLVLIAVPKTRRGAQCRLESTSVSTAAQSTETSACTSPLSGTPSPFLSSDG